MKLQKVWIIISAVLAVALCASMASAGDFDWTRNFNIRAEADPSGFRAGLASRFHVGDAEINAVIGNLERPADAYMVFRLGEMSSRSPEYVMERYRSEKGKGWGVLAKSLGIKPGSKEFHALKRGDDLYDRHGHIRYSHNGKDKDKDKDWKSKDKEWKSKDKGKGKDKDKKHNDKGKGKGKD